MAHKEPPSYLLLELKTSRSECIKLDERDMKGIKNDGYLVVVLDEPSYEGPVLGFIPHSEISVGTHNKADLRHKRITGSWWIDEINSRWTDWMLNTDALNEIISAKHSKISDRINWYLRINSLENGLRKSRRKGAIKDQFLRKSLKELHKKMVSQIEGQFHQYLVLDIIRRSNTLRYEPVNNPTGVPDIHARRLKDAQEIRSIILKWCESNNKEYIHFESLSDKELLDLYIKLHQ